LLVSGLFGNLKHRKDENLQTNLSTLFVPLVVPPEAPPPASPEPELPPPTTTEAVADTDEARPDCAPVDVADNAELFRVAVSMLVTMELEVDKMMDAELACAEMRVEEKSDRMRRA
jgi:hypothetical protein